MPYQLQLPDGMTPERLCDEVSGAVWRSVPAPSGAAPFPGEGFPRVMAAVRRVMERRLYAHDTCDLHRSCLDASRPAAWNDRPRTVVGLEARRHLRLIHLKADDGLDGFADDLAGQVLLAVGPSDPGVVRDSVALTRVREALRTAIGPYLYEGDLCETDQLMRTAERAPVFRNA